MDTLDNRTPQNDASGLQAKCDSLQHLVVSILILVVVMSGTLNIYLLRQWVWTKRDLSGIRPQASQTIEDYKKQSVLITEFVKKIIDYGHTHPDFAPILTKYNLKATAAPAAPSPATPAPRPATAPAPTKK